MRSDKYLTCQFLESNNSCGTDALNLRVVHKQLGRWDCQDIYTRYTLQHQQMRFIEPGTNSETTSVTLIKLLAWVNLIWPSF